MSEAARAVVEYGFAELDLHRIEASRRPENIGSARVMENVGLACEGTLCGYYFKSEVFLDAAMHGMVWDEE